MLRPSSTAHTGAQVWNLERRDVPSALACAEWSVPGCVRLCHRCDFWVSSPLRCFCPLDEGTVGEAMTDSDRIVMHSPSCHEASRYAHLCCGENTQFLTLPPSREDQCTREMCSCKNCVFKVACVLKVAGVSGPHRTAPRVLP